jgi:hypothetical protein
LVASGLAKTTEQAVYQGIQANRIPSMEANGKRLVEASEAKAWIDQMIIKREGADRNRWQQDVIREYAQHHGVTRDQAKTLLEIDASRFKAKVDLLGVERAVRLFFQTAEFVQWAWYEKDYGALPRQIRDAVEREGTRRRREAVA